MGNDTAGSEEELGGAGAMCCGMAPSLRAKRAVETSLLRLSVDFRGGMVRKRGGSGKGGLQERVKVGFHSRLIDGPGDGRDERDGIGGEGGHANACMCICMRLAAGE